MWKVAITENLIPYAKEMKAFKGLYHDELEKRLIGLAVVTKKQYDELFNIAENTGGFLCGFHPEYSKEVKAK